MLERYKYATEYGITVIVKRRSATVILAMKRFAMLEDDDFFNTTNNPIELPRKATKNITAYAMVKPILNSVEIGSPRDDAAVVLVPLIPVVLSIVDVRIFFHSNCPLCMCSAILCWVGSDEKVQGSKY